MRAPPICQSLRGIKTPKAVAFYAVSPVTGGRPRWSPAQPWPPAQEVPHPARVRFYDKGMTARWADVVIDRSRAGAEDSVALPRKAEHLRRVNRERMRRLMRKKRARPVEQVQERVARLEAEVAAMKAERKDPKT